MNIGRGIIQARNCRGMTQKELSDLAHVTQTYMSLVEKGHKDPSMNLLNRISKVLGIPVSVIFWYAMDDHDCTSFEKVSRYRIVKPVIDGLMNSLIEK